MSLVVVYEDKVMLACDKPAGIIVHTDGTGAPTLTDLVVDHLRDKGFPNILPQAVNRLDAPTTGLVLFSLDHAMQPTLDAQVAGHSMHKRYLAVVSGSLQAGEHVVDAPIARDRHDARRMRVSTTGKPSVTRVRVLDERRGRTLVSVEIETGRRHQIRVHLAQIGHPVVGDDLYGGAASKKGLLLHALSADVVHPLSGETIHLQTAWPIRLWPEL